ncbi:hypothetical protein J3R82DRAFT_6525 [Butyriboletus roseoflavus]|nr:hypothetical protein J3R82DRAFT_6525 [Butyriboletus roseoflavus]
MRTKPFQGILTFPAGHGSHGYCECNAQAWVRAPDLTPNAVVQGDARVKISAEYPAIENVSLGLQFKERSFVKALRFREDMKRLNPERPKYDYSNPSLWVPSRFANKSVKEAYEKTITNEALWIVR